MQESILKDIDSVNAEGIDFVGFDFPFDNVVFESYTRDEFEKCDTILKTNRVMWRIINGEKHYYCGKNDSGYAIWKDLECYKKGCKKRTVSNLGKEFAK